MIKANKNIILKECVFLLEQNIQGLYWIRLIREVNKSLKYQSICDITKAVFLDLIKNYKINYTQGGFFQFINKKSCLVNWNLLSKEKSGLNHKFFAPDAEINNDTIKHEIENTRVDVLYYNEIINNKIYKILTSAGIITISDLNTHILKHGNFMKIKGCDNKSNYDILQIYEEYYEEMTNDQLLADTKIDLSEKKSSKKARIKKNKIKTKNVKQKKVIVDIIDTFNAKLISKKAYEICDILNINNTLELSLFIKTYNNFLMIKGCTKKENEQLLKLDEFYNNGFSL